MGFASLEIRSLQKICLFLFTGVRNIYYIPPNLFNKDVPCNTFEIDCGSDFMKKNIHSSDLSDFSEKDFYRLCYEFSTDIIYLLNEDSIVEYVSPSIQQVLGYEPEECVGSSFITINRCMREQSIHYMMDFQTLLFGMKIINREYTCFTKNDRKLVFEINGSPYYKNNKIKGAVITAHDITHKKEYENELKDILGNLRKSLDITIKTISRTIDFKDPYTAGHQQMVSDLARSIATQMNLGIDAVNGIRMAGIVHDIGKISIPSEILSKELIKIHPTIGFDILSTIDFPWPIAATVLFHHERIDGSGYPYGVTGEFILQDAKIIGVADVVSALSSHRPYRPSIGVEMALEEIERNAGKLYDPDVVATCLSLFRDKGYMFAS
jgi:PAS domain S-box-containing protein